MIHGEKTDWMVRAEIILSNSSQDKVFTVFDRFAQFEESKGKSMAQLLQIFADLRNANLNLLKSKALTTADLDKTGNHPAFGEVTLRELLATWTAHDLRHLAQMARVIAKQYQNEVGPWRTYLSVMDRK